MEAKYVLKGFPPSALVGLVISCLLLLRAVVEMESLWEHQFGKSGNQQWLRLLQTVFFGVGMIFVCLFVDIFEVEPRSFHRNSQKASRVCKKL